MSASDSEISFSKVDCTCTAYDGSTNSLVIAGIQSDISLTREGTKYVEARTRDLHASGTPILRKVGDGNWTGSFSMLVSSFYGSTSVTPREFLTFTGGASGFTSTARGDKPACKLVLAISASGAGGAIQTLTLNYCVVTSVKIDPAGADGLFMMTVEFTDHENEITFA
jgi:hypothetical protein